MAKILAKARQSQVLASYRPDDLDYAKYENVNLAKQRAASRPASETRINAKRESHDERRSKTPTSLHKHRDPEKRSKTPTDLTNSNKHRDPEKRSKTPTDLTRGMTHDRGPTGVRDKMKERRPKTSIDFDQKGDEDFTRSALGHGVNPVLQKRPGSSSSRKSEEASKKLVQFRKCKTDIKILPDKQRPQTVQGLTGKAFSVDKRKISSSNQPLSEVRRKLQFENVDNDERIHSHETDQLDFTDKLVAIKNVIDKSRDTRDILDRKAYYNEYKSSQKRVMVSRSDSLKENRRDCGDSFVVPDDLPRDATESDREIHRMNRHGSQERRDRSRESRTRDVKSADIFESRTNEGRMSVDLNKLRANLTEKRQTAKDDLKHEMGNDSHDSKPKRVYAARSSSPKISKSADNFVEDLSHAKVDRKIIRSSAKTRQETLESNIQDTKSEEISKASNLRPSSRQEERPSSRQQGRPQSRLEDRPSSRTSARLETRETQTNLNHSIHSVQSNVPFYESSKTSPEKFSSEKTQRRTQNKFQDDLGLKSAVGLENRTNHISPEKYNIFDDKQTNVGDYLNTSADVRGETLKYSHKEVDKDLEHLRSKLSWLMDRDSGKLERHPNSKPLGLYEENLFRQKDSNDNRERIKRRSNTLADLLLSEEKLERGNEENVDQKVRDWIKTQQVISGNYHSNNQRNIQAVVIEELSVSVSIRNETNAARHGEAEVPADDLNDTCDKIPVKLEKDNKDSRPSTALSNKARQRITGARVTGQILHKGDIRDQLLQRDTLRDLKGPQGDVFEGPTKGIQGRGLPNTKDQADEESSETSSVLSLPFSVRSGESVSSTIQAVKLLRKLYHVEPDRRQNLVLMARCFRRWLNNVLYAKARNLEITRAAQNVSPVTYGVMIRKGEICYRTALLSRYFIKWKEQLDNAKLNNAIAALQRKHLLRKGMNAFKWAINRSKLRQGILQDRVSGILLASNFRKWKYRAIENRRLRMQQAFLRWRQYTKEAQKVKALFPLIEDLPITPMQRIRTLRSQTNMNLKIKLFKHWCERYATRVKQHRADANYRSKLLCQSWLSWKLFVVLTKEKKHRQTLAIQLYEGTLQKKMFVQMKIEFSKYTQAKQKHRVCQLKIALRAWKMGTQLSKDERINNTRVAEVCWIRTTIRTTFTSWRDALLTRRAIRMSDAVISKKSFKLWHDRYKFLVQRRADIDLYVRTKALKRSFQQWIEFVGVMRQRRERGIECLHNVLQRRVIQTWIWYTHNQRDLRRRLKLYIRKTEIESQKKYLEFWRSKFKVKCDEQRAQQFWSNMCAKKAADHWKMICHRRKLVRILRETEPKRQLTHQQVFFMKWLSRLQQIEKEKQEASDVRLVLDKSLMKKSFDKWRIASQKLLLIKPMVLRYRHTIVTECFRQWHDYVVHKAHCRQGHEEVIRLRLKNKFAAWRRQYAVHQIEKDFNKKLVNRQAVRCLQAWKFVIQRKHAAKRFYDNHMMKSSFYYWNMLTVQQVRQKKLQHMEQESVMNTLREYFTRWRDRVHEQQTKAEHGLTHIQQLQVTNSLRTMFTFWRRHFRATLIARENEKIRTRRLAKQALQEWHQHTQRSLQDAVHRFAAAIGLHVETGAGDSWVEHGDFNERSNLSESEMMLETQLEPLNLEAAGTPDSVQSPRTPRTPKTPKTPHTPRTPRQRSGYATPLKRLFSQSPSRQSLTQSHDFDAAPLLSSSFLDARFEMEQAVKTESRREIVVTAITRLRHWPLSNIFDQWKEFTARQLEFKHLTTQIKSSQEKLDLMMYFKSWMSHFKNTQVAKQHYNQVIQHKALLSLILYRNTRKQKNHLKHMANQHYARNVYTAVFPMWLQKTQEKQHTEHILHLWSNITTEEQQLIPRERSFKYRLNRKLLVTCFKTWETQFRKIDKLKTVYHRIILERYFVAWSTWALDKHKQRICCEKFRSKRIKSLVFKQWCLRYKQKTEVAKRYQDTWQNYKGRIFQAWHAWATDQRKYKLLAQQVMLTRNTHLVTQFFVTWKTSAEKQIQMQKYFEDKLSRRSLRAWHQVAVWQKDIRKRMVECRLMSYKILARQAFVHWYNSYCRKVETQKLHNQIVEKRVLRIAKKWRRKAQTTRGKWLKQKLEQRLVQRNLEKWKAAYSKHEDRLVVLDQYVSNKNSILLSQCLSTWRTELMTLQAGRVFDMKLLAAFVDNWKITAKGCKERRLALQAHLAKKQIHIQKGYFLYWFNVARARKSIRGHANLKIQLSVFKAWLLYTRKQNNLRRLEKTFTRKCNEKVQQKYWYYMKTRFHYCVELTDMANRVVRDKNNRLMKMALDHWDFRLKIVIADEFYEHLLAKRTARQWLGFVDRRKQERQHMEELMKKASLFYNKKLCVKVYTAWHNEVLATRHNNKRKVKLGEKYARIWKHRVDLAYTATCMHKEKLYLLAWRKWHLEFVKRKAELKMVAFEKKQTLSMILISWRNLCRKKSRRLSMIPLPVSPAFSMPAAPRSSSSTPTDEVFTPSPTTTKPTQIPLPSGSGSRNKNTATTNGRNTPTNGTGRNTPTNVNGRSTPTLTTRKSSSALL